MQKTITTGGTDDEKERRNALPNEWRIGALTAPCTRPGPFCAATLAPWCCAYYLRKRALHGDLSRYVCCGGAFPCSGRMGESKAPELCLACETFLCFPTAVSVTRFLIQDEMGLRNSQTDNCLIGTQFVIAQLACICSCAAWISGSEELSDIANCLTCVADVGWCLLCGCLQAQHYDALEMRDEGAKAPPPTVLAAPTPQQMEGGARV